jgi:hypothetical protein
VTSKKILGGTEDLKKCESINMAWTAWMSLLKTTSSLSSHIRRNKQFTGTLPAFLLPQASSWLFSFACPLAGSATVFSQNRMKTLSAKTPAMRTYLIRDFSRTLLSGLVLLSLLCSSISGQEAPSFDWKPQYGVRVATAQDGDCATKVRNGDIVFIRHRGVFVDPKSEKFIQFDGDGGEPLRFVVGEKRIITGMEVGVIGQVLSAAPCADRRRSGAAAAAARCNCAHTRPWTSRHAAARICRAQATGDGDIAAWPIRWTAAHRPLPPPSRSC